ncbi:PREDICTED: protein Mis18-alpha-like [Priapulus caudatus]|uniref:Protein Mis18-alpha-like n=1 Tax=Priapulus caudatus TaxID=37621 RepID=A0ABM1E0Y4_PRICU|nr:PREDICTED: protein Mis18-alpha-like [Priapulus caudatus]
MEEPTPSVGDAHIVFQCAKCNVIIGDSTSWAFANKSLSGVVLHATTQNVTETQMVRTSDEDVDFGSTYTLLQCNNCKTTIGRVYKTTPKKLDEVRDLFMFSVPMISSYHLGSFEQKTNTNAENLLDIPTARYLNSQLWKIQSLIVTMNNRLTALENCVEVESNDELNGDVPV